MTRALILTALIACNPAEETDPQGQEVVLNVEALVGSVPAACGQDYSFGTSQTPGQLADARVFLSGIELQNAAGDWVPLTLNSDSPWQHESVVLLDFEDASAACADSGTPELNSEIKGTLPEGSYEGIRFDVGVPYELNHSDNANAPAPLNTPGMFWTWQGGYKFLRVDVMLNDGHSFRWNNHIGSTGCVSDSPVNPPSAPCNHPNRATITQANFSLESPLRLDLSALLSQTDVLADTPDSPPGCMSAPNEPLDCDGPFAALGLSFETGDCSNDCADQLLVLP